jgi:hypothetical protein
VSNRYFDDADYLGEPDDDGSWLAMLERERLRRARRRLQPAPAPAWTPAELARLRADLVRARDKHGRRGVLPG